MMGKIVARLKIYKLRSWLRLILLLALWSVCILILVIATNNNPLQPVHNAVVNYEPVQILQKNQLGSSCYIHRDPQQNGRVIYSVSFESLLAENNQLGIFKTGLHKILRIDDLSFRSYQYSSDDSAQITNSGQLGIPGPSPHTSLHTQMLTSVARKLTGYDSLERINMDLGNVSEMAVKGFEYKIFRDGNLFFHIQSKRAGASYRNSSLALRGHVILTTAEGDTLESNRVKWDMESNIFDVDGVYVLNRNGVKTTGKDIYVDCQLNDTKTGHAKLKEKGDRNAS